MLPVFKLDPTRLAIADEEGNVMISGPDWKPKTFELQFHRKTTLVKCVGVTTLVIILFVLIMRICRVCSVSPSHNNPTDGYFWIILIEGRNCWPKPAGKVAATVHRVLSDD